jgi:uncharacterized protein (DUF1919 family)
MIKLLQKRFNRWAFKHSIRKLKHTEFCIVANNCLGSRLYQILGRQYNTPFVGLLVRPPCFAKLVGNFEAYMATELTFKKKSQYSNHPNARRSSSPCPIGLLGDVELQFIHYSSEEEAARKWNQRKARIIQSKLYYILVVDGNCDREIISQYLGEDSHNKVCFHPDEKLTMPACVYIPSKRVAMGNLYAQYHRLAGRFDFVKWILHSKKNLNK